MKYIDEFQDKEITDKILSAIRRIERREVNPAPHVKARGFTAGGVNLMEVCGTHTVSIFKNGIKNLLPKNINLISGPGCPVCVTSQKDIDRMISLTQNPGVIITTFGDMLKVPGTNSALETERASGCDIRIVYSPLDALEIAENNKNKNVIFLAVGFETTSPAIASVIDDAQQAKINNFYIYSSLKRVIPAIKTLLETQETKLDGFILPGHVSTIIGSSVYEFISRDYKIPCVISGFEPVDILESVLMLLKQIKNNTPKVEIQYSRVVQKDGNLLALKILDKIFTPNQADWRGLGYIKESGYTLNKRYKDFDAEEKFKTKTVRASLVSALKHKHCLCGEILRGIKTPAKCKLFAKFCNPENPYGPCMVSSEGTCAAWYKYNLKKVTKSPVL